MSLFASDKNLAMELVRGTEAAVMASGRWMGRNNKEEVDRSAVEAMRYMLNTVDMQGTIVIGEGEKDEAPMLSNGEKLGTGNGPEIDIAVDPIDGTRLMAMGLGGAISVVAAADRGSMFSPGNLFYFQKIATGPEAADFIDIDAPVHVNIRRVARAKNKSIDDVTVIMLNRPRNENELAFYSGFHNLDSFSELDSELDSEINSDSPDSAVIPNLPDSEDFPIHTFKTEEEITLAAREFLPRGVKGVVVTRGASGGVVATNRECFAYAPFKVRSVDSTGAGDSFCAALTVGLCGGMTLAQASRFASAAGALACTRFGAHPSLPWRHEVEALLERFPENNAANSKRV
ncbi:hypothetical protein FACS1894204_04690 [Synergistales bacterium]|nr:hypothetical protein FACS1894204_04690 [Synergistales bacterium]